MIRMLSRFSAIKRALLDWVKFGWHAVSHENLDVESITRTNRLPFDANFEHCAPYYQVHLKHTKFFGLRVSHRHYTTVLRKKGEQWVWWDYVGMLPVSRHFAEILDYILVTTHLRIDYYDIREV